MRFFTINGALAKFQGRSDDKVRLAAVAPSDNVTDAAPSALPRPSTLPATPGPEPFGMYAFRAPEGVLWTKWRKVQKELSGEEPRLVNCLVNSDDCDTASRTLIRLALTATTLDQAVEV